MNALKSIWALMGWLMWEEILEKGPLAQEISWVVEVVPRKGPRSKSRRGCREVCKNKSTTALSHLMLWLRSMSCHTMWWGGHKLQPWRHDLAQILLLEHQGGIQAGLCMRGVQWGKQVRTTVSQLCWTFTKVNMNTFPYSMKFHLNF